MFKSSRLVLATSAVLLAHTMAAWAVEPSDTPLASGSVVSVKPNVMFTLDDSGSMNSEAMPDDMEDWPNAVGRRSHQCNSIYYNPATTYTPPPLEDGSGNLPDRSFTAACSNGYSGYPTDRTQAVTSPSCTVNLSTSFRAAPDFQGNNADGANKAAYYYVYTGTQLDAYGKLPATGAACKTLVDSGVSLTTVPAIATFPATITSAGTGGGTWTKVTVSATSGPGATDEQVNFANWYSYYRKRLMMMKAAGGRAFYPLTNRYRVGFITINPNNPVTDSKFVPLGDYDAAQKSRWYKQLYSQSTNGSTPLREALSRVGRYYAGKTNDINDGMIGASPKLDPVQYSCQQNFTILTTDGYWNGGVGKLLSGTGMASTDTFDSIYGELDANNVTGAKFSITPFPIFDGAAETRTTTEKENEYQVTSSGCSAVNIGTVLQERTSQLQESTSTLTTQTSTLEKRTGTLQTCPKSLGSCSSGDWTNTASCTWDTSGGSRRSCRYNWGTWTTAVATCTKAYSSNTSNGTVWSGNGTDCQYTAWTAAVPVATCSAVNQSAGPTTYSVLNARSCSTQVTTALHNVSSCTATVAADASGHTTQCAYGAWSGYTDSPSCVALAQSTGPSYTVGVAKQCANNNVTIATQKMQYRTYTKTTTATFSAGVQQGAASGGSWTGPTGWGDVTGTSCTRVDQATAPYSPVPSRRVPVSGEAPLPVAPCTAWPCSTSTAAAGGSKRSLADVAQYYYVTDLRPTGTLGAGGVDVSENNVPSAGTGAEDDRATWQHMTTFTLGLGVAGQLTYRSDYKTAQTGDFASIRAGTLNWPAPPDSTSLVPSKLDDLWHAAVNGRGQFFSAGDPDTVVSSLNQALAGVSNRVASAAAAATSTLEPVSGDNFAYIAKYVTGTWSGDLEAKTIALVNDAATGVHAGDVSATAVWNAATKLAAQTANSCDTRTVKLFRSGAANNLVDFKWNTYTCTAGVPSGSAVTTLNAAEQAYFDSTEIAAMGQYVSMTDGSGGTPNQRTLAAGAPLVNFLRGQRANESFEAGSATAFYRARTSVLGDIVNAQPLYVRSPTRNYTDAGYGAYKTAQAGRAPVVYIAANDGLLHAFNAAADGGDELWAFMPTFSLANLYRLADTDYSANHRYFTDGSPISNDVYDATTSTWKTILVGGLNKGGKGYYALDITDPANPKGLWEFTNANMGYTYGNPIIGKLNDGTWVVFMTSGLNNADGKGYLFVVDAMTGNLRYQIATTAGSAGTPSGLNHITGWVTDNADTNVTFNHIYGVDLLGNVWRFDINDAILPAGREAALVTTLVDSSNNPQPITTKPIAALVGNSIRLYIGTGSYLSENDLTDTQTQTVYGFIDSLDTSAYPAAMISNVRSALTQQTLMSVGSGTTAVRGFPSCLPVTAGWYVDLPDAKERVNVDMRRALGSLFVASNVPEPSACRVGGYSLGTTLDLNTGCVSGASETAPAGYVAGGASAGKIGSYIEVTIGGVTKYMRVASTRAGTSGESLVVGVSIVIIDGKIFAIVQFSDGHTETIDPAIQDTAPAGRRLTWREIVQQ